MSGPNVLREDVVYYLEEALEGQDISICVTLEFGLISDGAYGTYCLSKDPCQPTKLGGWD